ncbi:MAG: choice-of-anchor J domain-containing protein [Muribaculaceae bacterium]|nr:choice-of-anchor J domain-containing protein [Muribaculaceae bacterium]
MKINAIIAIAAIAVSTAVQAAVPVRTTSAVSNRVISRAGHAATVTAVSNQPAFKVATHAPEVSYSVPFVHSLGKNESAVTEQYIVVDANEDTRTWKPGGFTSYSVCMKPNNAAVTANDDWLISPAVYLEAGQTYRASIEVGRALSTSGTAESFELMFGPEPTVDAMLTAAIPHTTYTHRDFEAITGDFTVAETGYYYFGIHCTSATATSGNMSACNFGIRVATPVLPAPAAGTLTYTLAPDGSTDANVTYTAPTLDVNGDPITGTMRVEIKTNYVLSHTFEDVVPGQQINFVTSLYNNGNNRIEATAWRGDVAGQSALVTGIFAGKDNPLQVKNLKATLSDDYRHVTLTWDSPGAVGEHGGYVDADNLVYYVFDAFGSYYDPALLETSETSVTFDYDTLEGQDFVAFQVTAGYDYYYSLDVSSNIVTVGAPDVLPWRESWADGRFQNTWCVDPKSGYNVIATTMNDNELQLNADDPDAAPVYLNSQDADNGFYLILPMEKNEIYGIFSPKFTLEGSASPVLDFYYQGKGSIVDALVSVDGGDFKVAKSINLKEQPTDDWTLCRVDLTPYADARYVQIEVRVNAVHNDDEHTWSVPLDNLSLHSLVDIDAAVSITSAPSKITVGEDINIAVKVENTGTGAIAVGTVELYRDGAKVASADFANIASGAFVAETFAVPTTIFDDAVTAFVAKVSVAGDEVEANNTSAVKSVEIEKNNFPTVENVEAISTPDGVQLTWTEPQFGDLTEPVARFEDFENPEYEPLTISDFGGWKMVDVDGMKTYTFLMDVNNPYRTMPMAFQLFDPVKGGVPDYYLIDIPPHSGDNLLVGWSSPGQNDNWLISPRLSGNEQTVKFWARSFSIAFYEEFEIYVSSTGTALSDFVKVDNVTNYPSYIYGGISEDWEEYSFVAPAGTKYFALRHISYDTYAIYLDDFTFEAAGELDTDFAIEGYNVYRNKSLVTSAPVTTPSHLDAVDAGTYDYHVSAVYNAGESSPSAPVTVVHQNSGVVGAIDNVTISAENHTINVIGATGQPTTIVNPLGNIIYRGVAPATLTVPASAGLYIVTVGDTSTKVVVR